MNADLDFTLRTLKKAAALLRALADEIEAAIGSISFDSVSIGTEDLDAESIDPDAPPMPITAVATRLGCKRQVVSSMLDAGTLPFVIVGKRRRIPVAALEAYLKGSNHG